ncbi:hypothetical protein CASFOL_011615 [Castilleja foliolosa]|uniref:Uncharacterized protein n=1 Tax=Castilleja foliolosa TaxID=1961234 RepID=A0ABD3DZY7_9LAMI
MSSKKRRRITIQERFRPFASDALSEKKRPKPPSPPRSSPPPSSAAKFSKRLSLSRKSSTRGMAIDNKVTEKNPANKLALP